MRALFGPDFFDPEAWAWVSLDMAAFTLAALTGTIGKGVLWRPIDRRLRGRYQLDVASHIYVTAQLRILTVVVTHPLPTQSLRELIGGGAMVVLYLDDYLAGKDGDNWKRRRKAVRNAIKWHLRDSAGLAERAH